MFVVSIPDYGVTPFGASNTSQIAEDIDKYNDYIIQRCNSLQLPFIDVTEISRNLGNSDGALAPDNLHPSASQYSKWLDVITPVVLELLYDE